MLRYFFLCITSILMLTSCSSDHTPISGNDLVEQNFEMNVPASDFSVDEDFRNYHEETKKGYSAIVLKGKDSLTARRFVLEHGLLPTNKVDQAGGKYTIDSLGFDFYGSFVIYYDNTAMRFNGRNMSLDYRIDFKQAYYKIVHLKNPKLIVFYDPRFDNLIFYHSSY